MRKNAEQKVQIYRGVHRPQVIQRCCHCHVSLNK